MRASGSNDVVYENCVIPQELFFEESEWGELDEGLLIIGTAGNLGLLGAFVGIAEAAREHIVELLRKRTKQPTGRPLAERRGIQHGMAELDIALNTCRAHLAWIGGHVDRIVVDRPVVVGLDGGAARADGRVPGVEARRAAHGDRRRRQGAPAERRGGIPQRSPLASLVPRRAGRARSCSRSRRTTRTSTSAGSASVSHRSWRTDPN